MTDKRDERGVLLPDNTTYYGYTPHTVKCSWPGVPKTLALEDVAELLRACFPEKSYQIEVALYRIRERQDDR